MKIEVGKTYPTNGGLEVMIYGRTMDGAFKGIVLTGGGTGQKIHYSLNGECYMWYYTIKGEKVVNEKVWKVGVVFFNRYNTHKVYHYLSCFECKKGDYVIVDSPNSGLTLVRVETVDPATGSYEGLKWIKSPVENFTQHISSSNNASSRVNEKVEKKKKADALQKKLNKIVAKKMEESAFKYLLDDPNYAAEVKEFFDLKKELEG